MSDYPSEWNLVPIGEIITESRIDPELDDPSKRIKVKLHCEGVEKRSERATDQAGATRYYRRLAGQFIYGKQNLHKGAVGIVPKELHGFCSSQDIPAFDIAPSVDPNWFLHLFQQCSFYESLERIATGTGSKRIQPSELGEKEIAVPPLPEQKKIAEILSGIDSVIKVQLDMASKVAKQYQGILHDVFSDESSCLPYGNYLPLEELGLDISDGNYSSKYPSANEFVERGIPFIRASNMKQGTIDDNDMRFISREKHQEITKGHLKSGDILIANRGEIGKACRVPARHRGSNINAQLVRINGGKKIDQSFLYHYISSPLCQALIDELTTGTALKQLPIGNLMKLPIPVPELNVQTAIGGSLDSMQRAISALRDKSKKYSQLKQAMASDLLSGRKRVTV